MVAGKQFLFQSQSGTLQLPDCDQNVANNYQTVIRMLQIMIVYNLLFNYVYAI